MIFWILFLLYQGLVAVVCCTNFPATPLVRHLLCYATGACKLPRSGVKGPRGFKGAVEIRVRAKAVFSIQEFWDKGLCGPGRRKPRFQRIFVLERASDCHGFHYIENSKTKTTKIANLARKTLTNHTSQGTTASMDKNSCPHGFCFAWTCLNARACNIRPLAYAADNSRYASWSVWDPSWYVHRKDMKAYFVFRCIWHEQLDIWHSSRNDASAVAFVLPARCFTCTSLNHSLVVKSRPASYVWTCAVVRSMLLIPGPPAW